LVRFYVLVLLWRKKGFSE